MKILCALFGLLFSVIVSASPLHKVVVFGDSLSDNGNLFEYMKHQLPISPPYFKGRFTNGPIWVELLVEYYYPNNVKNHLADYAIGGAGVLDPQVEEDDAVFSLQSEISSYLLATGDKADKDSLFIVWIGSNNYLALPEDTEQATDNVVLGIRHGLERLVAKGAKHIMVVNLPDLGRTPAAREFDAVTILSEISRKHNEKTKLEMSLLTNQYPQVQWIHFDINEVLGDMINHPEKYGFTNITDTCYEALMDDNKISVLKMVSKVGLKASSHACDGYLFFDPVHPSAPGHRLMAEKTKLLFDKLGITFN